MPTERDFLDAIHADPEDTTNKLVFADWLEDQGDPRSGLLRLLVHWQEEGGEVPPELEALLRGEAGRRLRQLKGLGDLRPSPSGLFALALKGIPGESRPLPRDEWAWITDLGAAKERHFRALPAFVARLPYPPRVEIRLDGRSAWQVLRAYLAADAWRLVRRLTVHDGGLGLAEIRAVLASLAPGQLHELRLPHNGLTDEAIALLAGSPRLAGLRVLDLSGNPFGNAGLRALLAAPRLAAGLRRSDVLGRYVVLPALEAWLGSTFFPAAESLDFDAGRWHLEARRTVPLRPDDPPLRAACDLTLRGGSLDPAGVAALTRLFGPGRLRRLELRRCFYTPDTWHALLAAPFLQGLRELTVEGLFGLDGDVGPLLAAPSFAGLVRLNLFSPGATTLRFTDDGTGPTREVAVAGLHQRFPSLEVRE